MKKFTFLFVMMLAFAGFTMAQTIENFENITMNLFSQGTTGSLAVVANPDSSVANPSAMVCKFVIDSAKRDPWAGWYGPATVDVNVTRYVHIKVWKTRISPVDFKLEVGTSANTGDIYPMYTADTSNATVNQWEELVFDYGKFTGTYKQIVFIPDFENPLTKNLPPQTIYFDDIYVNNDSTVGSAPVQMIENFETIPMHPYNEEGTFTLLDNPDKSGINLSNKVMDFLRPTTAPDWAGFYSLLAATGFDSVDVTTNKYVHVKAWKPRISLVKFKLEGGAAGTEEIASMNAQTKVNEWEDFVFDFSDKTGKYPIIGLSLDAGADPLTEDIHIYFDDIIVNNSPTPKTQTEQIISVDMNGANLVDGDSVFISGAIGGIYGSWNEPGTNLNNLMTDPDGDGIYTILMHLPDGPITFKFFKNRGWNGGDPFTGGDRSLNVVGSMYLVYTWGVGGFEVSTRKNPLAGKILMYPNPVRDNLTISTTSDIRKVMITNTLGKVVGNYTYTSNQTLNTKNLSTGMYFVTFIGRDGSKVTQKLIKD